MTLLWAAGYLSWYDAETFVLEEVATVVTALSLLNVLVFLARQGKLGLVGTRAAAFVLATLASIAFISSFVLVHVFPVLVCIYFYE